MTDSDSRAGGFTLIELLIAIAVTGLLLGVILPFFSTNYTYFREQEQVAEAQQNARAAMQIISRDLLMAGYSTASGIRFANHTSLTFAFKNFTTPTFKNLSTIRYKRYSGNNIGRITVGKRQGVAGLIKRLAFSYYSSIEPFPMNTDGSGNVPANKVMRVMVTVTAGTPVFGRYSASCTLTNTIAPRGILYGLP